jgi:hypothetical protein
MVRRYKYSPSVKTFTDGTSTDGSCLSVKVFIDGLSIGITAYNDGPSVAVAVLWCTVHRIQDESSLHKLNSRWEGPFVVKQVTRPGSYRLQYPEGQDVPNSWNIQNLRKSLPMRKRAGIAVL